MTNIFSHDYPAATIKARVLYTAFGRAVTDDVTTIQRAECWTLFNPRTGQTVTLANCPANLYTLHAYLKASWTRTNDDESLAGLGDANV
jgi:hypothetical protein